MYFFVSFLKVEVVLGCVNNIDWNWENVAVNHAALSRVDNNGYFYN